jgi:hypothetical protein
LFEPPQRWRLGLLRLKRRIRFYQNFSLAMQVVPEPSALLLLLAAGPILFAFAHRRKKLPPR